MKSRLRFWPGASNPPHPWTLTGWNWDSHSFETQSTHTVREIKSCSMLWYKYAVIILKLCDMHAIPITLFSFTTVLQCTILGLKKLFLF